jgi:hypothetical protein
MENCTKSLWRWSVLSVIDKEQLNTCEVLSVCSYILLWWYFCRLFHWDLFLKMILLLNYLTA